MGFQQWGLAALQQCRNLAESCKKEREHFPKIDAYFDVFQTDTYSYLVQAGIDIWMPSFSSQIQQTSLLFFMIE